MLSFINKEAKKILLTYKHKMCLSLTIWVKNDAERKTIRQETKIIGGILRYRYQKDTEVSQYSVNCRGSCAEKFLRHF